MKKLNLLLLTLVTLLALTSFSGNDKVFNNADKWIPADFDPRKTILLVQCFVSDNNLFPNAPDNAGKNIAKYMQEKYPYKFEVVTESIDNNKYDNKENYRYVLIINKSANSVSSPSGQSSYIELDDCHIWDRKLNKHYKETGNGSQILMKVFRPTINTIVKFLSEKK